MVDSAIQQVAQSYLQSLCALGIPVERGIIFGSYARGSATPWSDIDLLVVSSRFDAPRTREVVNMLWRTAAREDARIEPVPCGKIEWESSTDSAIVEVARREGLLVAM